MRGFVIPRLDHPDGTSAPPKTEVHSAEIPPTPPGRHPEEQRRVEGVGSRKALFEAWHGALPAPLARRSFRLPKEYTVSIKTISESAIRSRVARALAAAGERLWKPRAGTRACDDYGPYAVVDDRNILQSWGHHIDALARDLGVMRPGEALE